MEVHAGELLIARMWRWDAEKLRASAERDMAVSLAEGEEDPEYGISTFGRIVEPGEDAEAAMRALCALIPINARWVAFTTRTRLRDSGFEVRYSPEVAPGHYDVLLGRDLDAADVKGLQAVFDEEPKRRFPTCQL